MEIVLNGVSYRIGAVAPQSLRVTDTAAPASCLDRYGITRATEDATQAGYEIKGDALVLLGADGTPLTALRFTYRRGAWRAILTAEAGEHFYGLGDVTRDRLDKRGYQGSMWVTNVQSYQPIPFLMSSRGWALAVNTTYQHAFDICATKEDELTVTCEYGAPDVTLFTGRDYAELLKNYTAFAGRPLLLPRFAMGLTYVCNTDIDAFGMMNEAYTFRSEKIPCDIIGLEPGWMDHNYDLSTKKKWSDERFHIPSYAPKGNHTFMAALDRLGFKLSLWLCCNYDLIQHEEQLYEEAHRTADETDDSAAFEKDTHLSGRKMMSDNLTVPGEPWFEHLKKFVDQGASCFKLDGAYQVIEHPDRLWAGKFRDEEIHNVYPVVYAKQMSEGFTDHTARRAMIYTAGGYTGIQKYAATWAGDTGGDFGPLVSLLNLGVCGHSNTSCDMDVFSHTSLHFGFLQPWAQLNNWFYWRQPWYLTDEDKAIFREYTELRYALVPYMYTAAHDAYETGMPIMRALPLMYPQDELVYERDRMTEYMLGDDLLVGAFLEKGEYEKDGKRLNMYLPEGKWHDYFTGEVYLGGQEIFYTPPKNRGGALFVRDGAILPLAEVRQFVGNAPYTSYTLHVFGETAEGRLYTDDGITMKYREGEGKTTRFAYRDGKLTVTESGDYEGAPEVTYTVKAQ